MVKTQTFQIFEIVHNIQFKESMVFGQGKRLFTLSGAWATRRIKSGYVPITVAILRICFWQFFWNAKIKWCWGFSIVRFVNLSSKNCQIFVYKVRTSNQEQKMNQMLKFLKFSYHLWPNLTKSSDRWSPLQLHQKIDKKNWQLIWLNLLLDNHQSFLQFASCQQNYNHNESSRFSIKLKMVHEVGLFKSSLWLSN